jgi:ABC-type phosphate transport system auxiliary subunit
VSRAFVIRVAAGNRRVVQVADGVCTDIELLPILPRERLGEILGAELEGRGFTISEGSARRVDDDGVEIAVELETGQVSARVEEREVVERGAERNVRSVNAELSASARKAVEKELNEQLEREIDAEQKKMQREVTKKLEEKLRDLQQELDEVSKRVAGAALKEKAGQLGEITELSEDASGGITIKVKV